MARQFTGRKMGKEWVAIPGFDAPLTADGTTLPGFFAGTVSQTVLRMLGEYIISPTIAPTAGDHCTVTVGIGIVSTDAATVGSTAVPDPAGDPDFPWLYWKGHPMWYGGTDLNGGNPAGGLRQVFDIRSMRKMKAKESLIICAQYEDGSGAPAVEWKGGATRVLVGLH